MDKTLTFRFVNFASGRGKVLGVDKVGARDRIVARVESEVWLQSSCGD